MSAQVGYGGFSAWLQGLLAQWKAEELRDAAAELFLILIIMSFSLSDLRVCVWWFSLSLRGKIKH